MLDQKEKPGLKGGQTLWISDEDEWNRRLSLKIVQNGEFKKDIFDAKYGNLPNLSSGLTDLERLAKETSVWNDIDRKAINAFARLHRHIESWLFDPFQIVDINYVVVVLKDLHILSEYITEELFCLKEKRGC